MSVLDSSVRHRSTSDTFFIWALVGLVVVGLVWLSLYGVMALVAGIKGVAAPGVVEFLEITADHFPDPLAGLTEPVGPPALIYGLWIALMVVVAAVSVVLWLRWHATAQQRRTGQPRRKDLAPMHRRNAEKVARKTLERVLPEELRTAAGLGAGKSATEQPTSAPSVPAQRVPQMELVISLGSHLQREVCAQHEDSIMCIAPPRSGKTNFLAVNLILDAPGPVVVTGTKSDIVLTTAVAQKRKGDVRTFDPMDVAGWPVDAQWDPIAGCQDPDEALDRGKAWAAGGSGDSGSGEGNASWFRERASELLSYYLHAAALKGGDLSDVLLWASDFDLDEPIEILRESPAAAGARWPDMLLARTRSGSPQTIGSLQTTLSGLLAPLASPRILKRLIPSTFHRRFDIDEFLAGQNTLYLLTGKGGLAVSPLLTMFADYVIRKAQDRSQHMPGERLWPPLRVVLDEAANIAPIPTLPEVMSDSGGRGITTVVLCQSFAQMDKRWGSDEAETIRATATATLYLPGIKEQKRLEEISDLTGHYRMMRTSVSSDGSRTRSSEWEPVMTTDAIRRMPEGSGLLFYRGLRGAVIQLTPWWKRDDAKQLRRDVAEAERLTGRKLAEATPAAPAAEDEPEDEPGAAP